MHRQKAQMHSVIWALVGTILGFGWWLTEDDGRREGEQRRLMVSGMAPTYAESLRAMGHASVGLETAPDDPLYLKMIHAQKDWLKLNPAAHDIYTMRKLPDGRNVLIVDSETDYDRNGIIEGTTEERTAIGEVFEEKHPGLERALTGEPNFNTVPVSDRWGTWVTAWIPLLDQAGKVEAVLGVDYAAKEWVRGIAAARGARIAQLAVLLVLLGSSAFVIGMQRADIQKRQEIEKDLRRSQERLALRAEQTPLAVIEWDLDLQVVDWNAAAERLFGYTRTEAIGTQMLELIAPEPVREQILALRDGCLHPKTVPPCRDGLTTKDGREIVCQWFNSALVDGGRVIGVTSLCEDITGRRKLDEQVRQAQKLEAFGQLAGGIAHDFNNMLCAITGFTEIVRNRTDIPAEAIADLDQVASSADRAAALTRQLLTFSRRQIFQPLNLSINDIVLDVSKMIQRVVGQDVNVVTNLIPNPPEIHGDAGMIEQALVNLSVNARDAMPKGGRLVISTNIRMVGDEEASPLTGAVAGPVVCLEVADSGTGIAPEHLPQIYDPFFTTKEVGRGTGLGLATVYGIVQQHRGWITVESELGRGTIFRIHFPALVDAHALASSEPDPLPARGGNETILVVEDEIPVGNFVARLLRQHGYDVLTASSGIEALEVMEKESERIDMVLTDMIMPDGFSGADLARRLRDEHPHITIIYTSGYSMDFVGRKLVLLPGVNFLQKPYPPEDLIRLVRENLDRETAGV
jgi:PAS domain S-box-containing protein